MNAWRVSVQPALLRLCKARLHTLPRFEELVPLSHWEKSSAWQSEPCEEVLRELTTLCDHVALSRQPSQGSSYPRLCSADESSATVVAGLIPLCSQPELSALVLALLHLPMEWPSNAAVFWRMLSCHGHPSERLQKYVVSAFVGVCMVPAKAEWTVTDRELWKQIRYRATSVLRQPPTLGLARTVRSVASKLAGSLNPVSLRGAPAFPVRDLWQRHQTNFHEGKTCLCASCCVSCPVCFACMLVWELTTSVVHDSVGYLKKMTDVVGLASSKSSVGSVSSEEWATVAVLVMVLSALKLPSPRCETSHGGTQTDTENTAAREAFPDFPTPGVLLQRLQGAILSALQAVFAVRPSGTVSHTELILVPPPVADTLRSLAFVLTVPRLPIHPALIQGFWDFFRASVASADTQLPQLLSLNTRDLSLGLCVLLLSEDLQRHTDGSDGGTETKHESSESKRVDMDVESQDEETRTNPLQEVLISLTRAYELRCMHAEPTVCGDTKHQRSHDRCRLCSQFGGQSQPHELLSLACVYHSATAGMVRRKLDNVELNRFQAVEQWINAVLGFRVSVNATTLAPLKILMHSPLMNAETCLALCLKQQPPAKPTLTSPEAMITTVKNVLLLSQGNFLRDSAAQHVAFDVLSRSGSSLLSAWMESTLLYAGSVWRHVELSCDGDGDRLTCFLPSLIRDLAELCAERTLRHPRFRRSKKYSGGHSSEISLTGLVLSADFVSRSLDTLQDVGHAVTASHALYFVMRFTSCLLERAPLANGLPQHLAVQSLYPSSLLSSAPLLGFGRLARTIPALRWISPVFHHEMISHFPELVVLQDESCDALSSHMLCGIDDILDGSRAVLEQTDCIVGLKNLWSTASTTPKQLLASLELIALHVQPRATALWIHRVRDFSHVLLDAILGRMVAHPCTALEADKLTSTFASIWNDCLQALGTSLVFLTVSRLRELKHGAQEVKDVGNPDDAALVDPAELLELLPLVQRDASLLCVWFRCLSCILVRSRRALDMLSKSVPNEDDSESQDTSTVGAKRVREKPVAAPRSMRDGHTSAITKRSKRDAVAASMHPLSPDDIRRCCTSLSMLQESEILQTIIQLCLEESMPPLLTPESVAGQTRLLQCRSLSTVQESVCTFLHTEIIAQPSLLKLLHVQGYPVQAIPVLMQGVPSMHACLDFLAELLSLPSVEFQAFGIHILCGVCAHNPVTRALALAESVFTGILAAGADSALSLLRVGPADYTVAHALVGLVSCFVAEPKAAVLLERARDVFHLVHVKSTHMSGVAAERGDAVDGHSIAITEKLCDIVLSLVPSRLAVETS